MGILNKLQADELFHREAILIGREDVLPVSRAVALFGEKAVSFAKEAGEVRRWNAFGAGDFSVSYLYYTGFLAAVSYYNVQQLREEAKV